MLLNFHVYIVLIWSSETWFFNLEGQNSLFTQNMDTIFNVTKTHQKCTFWKLDISPNDFIFFVDFVWSLDRDVLSPAIL